MTTSDLPQSTDGELIAIYVKRRAESDAAMRVLVGRYADQMYARFFAKVKNDADANDLQQELWTRVARSLDRYRDEQKFAHYLSKLASNVLIDHYRKSGRDQSVFVDNYASGSEEYDHEFDADAYQDPALNVEQDVSNDELMQHLISVLVPGLPVEQRAAWLLRHESEYWEPGKRLEWSQLAELNALTELEVASLFEVARNTLMINSMTGKNQEHKPLKEIELLVFLVWTQAQRLDKSQNFIWDYFAQIMGQPVNTLKTRYREAQKALSNGLSAYMHE